jgi:hypothetical protein
VGLGAREMTQGVGEPESCPACGQPMKEARHIDTETGKSLPRPVLRWCSHENCFRYTVVDELNSGLTGVKGQPAAK